MASVQIRLQLLEELVACKLPIDAITSKLALHPWDWEGEPLVVLQFSHVRSVLQRYLADEMVAAQVEEWADALECREDIDYASEEMSSLLFRLSTPEINDEINPTLAEEILQSLGRAV